MAGVSEDLRVLSLAGASTALRAIDYLRQLEPGVGCVPGPIMCILRSSNLVSHMEAALLFRYPTSADACPISRIPLPR